MGCGEDRKGAIHSQGGLGLRGEEVVIIFIRLLRSERVTKSTYASGRRSLELADVWNQSDLHPYWQGQLYIHIFALWEALA